jgi:hypothetical protein
VLGVSEVAHLPAQSRGSHSHLTGCNQSTARIQNSAAHGRNGVAAGSPHGQCRRVVGGFGVSGRSKAAIMASTMKEA